MNWFLNGTLLATSASPGVGGCGTSVGTGVGKRKKKKERMGKKNKKIPVQVQYSEPTQWSTLPPSDLFIARSVLRPQVTEKGGMGYLPWRWVGV